MLRHTYASQGTFSVAAILAGIAFSGCVETLSAAEISNDLFRKQPVELAQILQAPPSEDEPAAPVEAVPEDSATDEDSAAPDDSDSFVFAGDLARQLRKIDPSAKVDWDGKKLRVRAQGQEFAIFPSGREMVINGNVESQDSPLKIRNGEIYVPNDVVARIGRELEKPAVGDDAATTTLEATPTPTPAPTATPSPTPEATPAASSILPDSPPTVVTPTPKADSTPSSVLPDASPVAAPPATATPEATPFPVATPTPTPKPTPTPSPTPVPAKATEEPARKPDLAANTDAFKSALRDKISVSTENQTLFTLTQLQEKAANRSIKKIVIHADDSGIAKSDEYGKECAEISLQIARRLEGQLKTAGMETVLTRATDKSIPIGQTLELIGQSGAQALIVVAVGYSTEFTDLGGYRIFYMNDSVDYNSLLTRSFDASEAVPVDLNYKSFQGASKVFASSLKNSIAATLNREPVGVNPVPQYLTRRAPMASSTVVVGYLSNPADAKRLVDETQQDAMATAIAEGIRNFATQVSQGEVAADGSGGL